MARKSWTHRSLSAAAAATAVVMLSGLAAAEGSYASAIPNGGGCDTCHTTGSDVNDFGADMGTGQSDLTWQLAGGVGYKFNWGDIGLHYRHVQWDFDNDSKLDDMSFSGPIISATFHF